MTINIGKRKSEEENSLSFEEFYRTYYEKIFWYIYKRLNHREDSQDLTNEIFCFCYQTYDTYDPDKSSLSSWLYMIANSRLKNFYRDKKVDEPIEDVMEILVSPSDDVDKAAWLDSCRDALADALKTLPERSRKIIIMKYYQYLSAEEIAKELDITPGNVRVLSKRALEKLNVYLKTKGFDSEEEA